MEGFPLTQACLMLYPCYRTTGIEWSRMHFSTFQCLQTNGISTHMYWLDGLQSGRKWRPVHCSQNSITLALPAIRLLQQAVDHMLLEHTSPGQWFLTSAVYGALLCLGEGAGLHSWQIFDESAAWINPPTCRHHPHQSPRLSYTCLHQHTTSMTTFDNQGQQYWLIRPLHSSCLKRSGCQAQGIQSTRLH